ncbi:DNA polymerase III subunit delta' [Sulfolobus sp. E1]|nr:DNA polymerase III subunit delta' [Sulfolobus sp. E1]
MITSNKLSLSEAKILAEGAEAEAKRLGIKVCIAISDDSGLPILFHRMEGAFLISIEISQSKAFIAVAVGMPTRQIGETAHPGKVNYGLQFSNLGKFTILPGWFPIIVDGKVVGGIGVSGGTGEQDEQIALYALKYFKENTKLNVKLDF